MRLTTSSCANISSSLAAASLKMASLLRMAWILLCCPLMRCSWATTSRVIWFCSNDALTRGATDHSLDDDQRGGNRSAACLKPDAIPQCREEPT